MTITLDGDTGNDSLEATTADDYILNGLGGNDTLDGGSGNDTLNGGDGNDHLIASLHAGTALYGGANDDDVLVNVNLGSETATLDGGAGNSDRLVNYSGSGALIDLAAQTITKNGATVHFTGFEEAEGNSFDDTLIGGNGSSLWGEDGNDHLILGTGAGYANGGIGDDVIDGGMGNDFLDGHAGSDTLRGNGGNDSLTAGYGTTIPGDTGLEVLDGGAGADTLTGGASEFEKHFRGSGGNDSIRPGDIVVVGDSYDGGAGIDTVDFTGHGAGVFVFGPTGTARIEGHVHDLINVEVLILDSGADRVTGDGKAYGNAGRDTMTGGSGSATLYGGSGNDRLVGTDGKVSLFGDTGNDRLILSNLTDDGSRINGGTETDTLAFSGSAAWGIDLAAGSISRGIVHMTVSGIEVVEAGSLADTVTGAGRAEVLYGGRGDDVLRGGGGDDTIEGGDGNDSIDGGAGNDVLSRGGDGDVDTIIGGAGVDVLTFTSGQGWIIDGIGHGVDALGTGAEISGVERFDLGDADDVVTESSSLNVINAGGGNDRIVDNGLNSADDRFDGGLGIDTISLINATGDRILSLGTGAFTGNGGAFGFENAEGGAWNDQITGSADDNVLSGGDGADSLLGDLGADSLNGDAGTDTLGGGDGADTLRGGTGNDLLNGDAKGDLLYGQDGNDTLNGGGNNDELHGGSQNDLLSGNTGDDLLLGEEGSDRLLGGLDRDTLTGGLDADVFIWAAVTESGLGEAADVVTDFGFGADVLFLRAIAGLSWIDSAAFSGVAGQVRQAVTGANTVVSIDSDGDLDADMEIVLENAAALIGAQVIL